MREVLGQIPTDPTMIASLVREFQGASISLAYDFYTEMRDAAGLTDLPRLPVIDPWAAESLTAYMDTAMKSIESETEKQLQAMATAERLTLDSGIDEVFAAMEADPEPVRWARVVQSGACSFCLLQAARGAVYRSETTATFRAHTRFEGRGGDCRCGVEPVFGQYEPTAHVRAAQSLYSEATADLPRGSDKANAFRRAVYAEQQTSR